jgi:hypothetical protein
MPPWLADWLGIPSGAAADGASWQLDSAWHWPPWATVLLVLAAILFTALLYARESSGAGRAYRVLLTVLRLVAIAIVLIMLAQWTLAVRLTGPAVIAIVLDRSASMSIADRYSAAELPPPIRERLVAAGLSEPTRLNLAKLLTSDNDAQLLRTLADRYRLHVYFVAGSIERASDSDDIASLTATVRELSADGPDSGATRLGDAVRRVLDDFRGAPPAAVVLLTDGATTDGVPLGDAAQEARIAGVPIFALGLGSGQPPRDIEVADVLVDDAVFINDLVSLQVQIKATGLDGEQATVTLRREGDATPLATQTIDLLAAGKSLSIRLVDRPTAAGDMNYVVEIAPRDDETDQQNNRQQRVVSVRDERIRVLLVYGYPNYEFRFLKTLLERDPTIALSTYLQDADPRYTEQDKTALASLPVSCDELFEYDVIVIGDADPRLVPRSVWLNMRAFVAEKGGGVAFIAGPRFLPWSYSDISDVAALLPIDIGSTAAAPYTLPSEISRGFVVQPTPLGLQSPAFQLGDSVAETEQVWHSLAPLYWLYEIDDLKPAAQVLATGMSIPPSALHTPPSAIIFHYVAAGRVLFHAIDSTWRWRIGAGDVYFARYWVQTVRFLARGKLTSGRGAQLNADRREYSRGEDVQLRVRFLDRRLAPPDDEVTVLIESPGQTRRRVALRRNPAAEGVFTGTITELSQGEYQVVLANPQVPGTPPNAQFTVTAPPGEFARLEMDVSALTAAAEVTRGKFYRIADADRLLADLPAGRRVPVENLPPISIWNRWWLFAAFLTCITTEWILRKQKGMI